MEGKNDSEMTKLDIAGPKIDAKGKQMCTAQDGDARECRLQGNSETESWIVQIQHRFNCGGYEQRKTSPKVCIYRVPELVRKTNRKDYDPVVVSLGPYHHKKYLSAMDDHKLQAVETVLRRLHPMTMDDLIREVTQLESKIRACYEDSAIDWDGNTLAWMLTMDACFILEFLREGLRNSSIVFNNIRKFEIELDILKLENQLPFIILEKILELELKGSEEVTVVLGKILTNYIYFTGYPFREALGVSKIGECEIWNPIIRRHPRHLLDLCGLVIEDFLQDSFVVADKYGSVSCIGITRRPRCSLFRSTSTDQDTCPSAEKLQRAGIKCKPSPNGKVQFIHRSFGRSTLFLPQIIVDDTTEMFLRNLMAFEECQIGALSPNKNIISLYVCLMDDLIESKEDVELLVKQNIIRNYMGSDDEVATLFNNLCRGITCEDREFKEIREMVNRHYNSQLNVLMHQFKEEHCSRPWYIISLVAAILLLGMTAVQTVFSVKI